MNDGDLVFKPLPALDDGKLPDVHPDPMTTDRDDPDGWVLERRFLGVVVFFVREK